MRLVLILINFACLFFHPALALTITVPSQAARNTPIPVVWTLDQGDPSEWDFRFVQNGQDVGLAAANVKTGGQQTGGVDVIFPGTGDLTLTAVAGPNHDVIGQSLTTQILDSLSSSSSTLPTSTISPSISITTVIPSATSSQSISSKRSTVNVPAIVGGIVGGLAFILLLIVLFLYVRRGRRKPNPSTLAPMQEVPQRKSWIQRIILTSPAPSPRAASGGPKGPRPLTKSTPLPRTVIMRPPRTERQQILDDKVASLLEEIGELQARGVRERAGEGAAGRVDEIRVQIRWLRELKEDPWALGETNEFPRGWEQFAV